MLSLPEIARGSYGAWRLLLGDPGGLTYFERSPRSMWRSFLLAPLLLPFYAPIALQHVFEVAPEAGWPRIIGAEISAYAISWCALPLAMSVICPLIEREKELDGFIEAYNWANIVHLALYLPLVLVEFAGILPEGAITLLEMGLAIVVLYYGWFIAKTALRLPSLGAIPIVALDLVFAVFITGVADLLVI